MNFISELKRRNVFKVAVAYAIVAWLLIEVSATLLPVFGAPDWILRVVVLFLAIGFVVALIISWAYELTPEGLKPTHEVDQDDSITHVTGQKINYIIIGVLVLAVGFMFVDNYVLEEAEPEAVVETAPAPVIEPVASEPVPEPEEETREVLPNSVAVLPFENLSLDPEDAFFAAGIHDEILNQLVKLRALNVIARTSVLQYAEERPPIPEIAEELNVETVMEGTVRYAGDRVRITAQLIDPETGAHLWSDTYEREFDDIFAIESDIAMNIANALEAEFSVEEQASIEKVPTDSTEAYRYYLAALNLQYSNRPDVPRMRVELLDQAIEEDSNFALAYARRADFLGNLLYLDSESQQEFEGRLAEIVPLINADLERAMALDPDLALPYLVAGHHHTRNWRGIEAAEAYARAYELSPNDAEVLRQYADFKTATGQHEDAVRMSRRRLELDPEAGIWGLGLDLAFAGETEESVSAFRKQLEQNPQDTTAHRRLAFYEASLGNGEEAGRHLAVLESKLNTFALPQVAGLASSYAQLGFEADAERILEVFDERAKTMRVTPIAQFQAAIARGDEEQALYWLERIAEQKDAYQGFGQTIELKLNGRNHPTLDLPQFVEVRKKLGFQDL